MYIIAASSRNVDDCLAPRRSAGCVRSNAAPTAAITQSPTLIDLLGREICARSRSDANPVEKDVEAAAARRREAPAGRGWLTLSSRLAVAPVRNARRGYEERVPLPKWPFQT